MNNLKACIVSLAGQSTSAYVTIPGAPSGFVAELSTAPLTGDSENQVIRLSWADEQVPHSVVLTEDGLTAATVNDDSIVFTIPDLDGDPVEISFISFAGILTVAHADPAMYLVVQEGGSSGELCIHVHDSLTDAHADRISCAEDGSYATSEPIEVPRSMLRHPSFISIAEKLMRSPLELDYPTNAQVEATHALCF